MHQICKIKMIIPVLVLTIILAIITRISMAHIIKERVGAEIIQIDGQVITRNRVCQIIKHDINHAYVFILQTQDHKERLTVETLESFSSDQQFTCEVWTDGTTPEKPKIYGLKLTPLD